MADRGELRALIAIGDVRRVLLAAGASSLGDRMALIALAFAVLESGGSPSALGLVLAAGTVPAVATLLFGGVVADRIDRRSVMVVADLVRVVSQGVMAAVVLAGAAEIWNLAALAAVTGAATGFFNPAATGILPTVVAPEQLQPANGLRGSTTSGAEIIGPLIAGGLIAATSPGWALVADAATFAVSAALLLRMTARPELARNPGTFAADLREGWSTFISRTWLWTVVVSAAFGNLTWGAWMALGPVVSDRELGGAAAWGILMAALGAGSLLGGIWATRTRPRRPLVMYAWTGTLFAVPVAALALAAPLPVLVVCAVIGAAGLVVGDAIWDATLQAHVPEEALSRVASHDWFWSMLSWPIGYAIWGPLSSLTGTTTALWLSIGVLFVVAAALLAIPDVRRLTAMPTPAARVVPPDKSPA